MKEIVIVSGKGGTGKTSITAALAYFAARKSVIADCDVDAADLHLILKPEIRNRTEFRSGFKAHIDSSSCMECGKCIELCRFGAIRYHSSVSGEKNDFSVDDIACEGCGVCVRHCPSKAVTLREQSCGEWFISSTRFGTLVHASLGIASENSGRLVTLVRNEAKKAAKIENASYVLIDGSPGIGCPVIASLTTADLALIITEPTVSGDHDLKRIAGLTKQLRVPTMVCVNKWDINTSATETIKNFAQSQEIGFAGLIRYDKVVTEAQRAEMAVPEYSSDGVAADIRKIWNAVLGRFQ